MTKQEEARFYRPLYNKDDILFVGGIELFDQQYALAAHGKHVKSIYLDQTTEDMLRNMNYLIRINESKENVQGRRIKLVDRFIRTTLYYVKLNYKQKPL